MIHQTDIEHYISNQCSSSFAKSTSQNLLNYILALLQRTDLPDDCTDIIPSFTDSCDSVESCENSKR